MFTAATLHFLDELAANNDKAWFEANKSRYEDLVRSPALEFIAAMAPGLAEFAPQFRADPRKMGGSLMRIYRDTRFSRDKTPYKTNIGIHFRHALGKNVHAPGFYVHVARDECFLGVGCWHPEAEALGKIRDALVAHPEKWFAVRDHDSFTRHWSLAGDRLTRPPQGYPTQHAALDDLKRKDFIALAPLSPADVCDPAFPALAGERFAAGAEFMRFLCQAVGVNY
ncbi:MAG: hypothetical protein RIR00_830 [Pseudomonadota bacterium]